MHNTKERAQHLCPSHSASRPVIAVLLHDFQLGGSERVAIRLANAWEQLGFRVILYAGNSIGGQRDLVSTRVEVIVADPPIRRTWYGPIHMAWWVGRRSARDRPDAHFLPGNSYFPVAWPLWLIAIRPVRIVAKLSNPLWRPDKNWLRNVIFRVLTRVYLARTAGIAVMSPALLRRDIPPPNLVARCKVVFDALFDKAPELVTRPRKRWHLCAVGRLAPQKDFATLLHCLSQLTDLPVTLTLVGDGELLPSLVDLARSLDLTNRVTFAGEVSDSRPYIAEAEALVLTSRYEGYPAVAVEAMAVGTFVIARDCSPALEDILHSPEIGTIVRDRGARALAIAVREFFIVREHVVRAPLRPATEGDITRHVATISAGRYLDLLGLPRPRSGY
jgi:glycosyltransferase involved in cell wall biosynthesis